jgi:hypothetical protein
VRYFEQKFQLRVCAKFLGGMQVKVSFICWCTNYREDFLNRGMGHLPRIPKKQIALAVDKVSKIVDYKVCTTE